MKWLLPIVISGFATASIARTIDSEISEVAQPNGEGLVKIHCSVLADGHVDRCTVLSEEPAGQGYGAAALRMSKMFKMKPKTSEGKSVAGAEVTIPIRFHLNDVAPGNGAKPGDGAQQPTEPSPRP